MFKDELEYEKKPGVDKQRTRTIEIEHYKADGSAIHMEIHISFVRNETGIPIESEPGKGSCFNFSLPV